MKVLHTCIIYCDAGLGFYYCLQAVGSMSVITQLCRVWSLSNNKCINEIKDLLMALIFFLIMNMFYDSGKDVDINFNERRGI